MLIDLTAAELLEAWFGLGIPTLTTSFVWREVNRRSQKARLRAFARSGQIEVVDMSSEILSEVLRLKMDLPRGLSLGDASVLYLAEKRAAVLLTGDRSLSKAAKSRAVPVYSLPALMDYMVRNAALSAASALDKLEILSRKNPWLPKQACEILKSKWRNQ